MAAVAAPYRGRALLAVDRPRRKRKGKGQPSVKGTGKRAAAAKRRKAGKV
jgi:hypothetical protein